jgi:hypothetical protein
VGYYESGRKIRYPEGSEQKGGEVMDAATGRIGKEKKCFG